MLRAIHNSSLAGRVLESRSQQRDTLRSFPFVDSRAHVTASALPSCRYSLSSHTPAVANRQGCSSPRRTSRFALRRPPAPPSEPGGEKLTEEPRKTLTLYSSSVDAACAPASELQDPLLSGRLPPEALWPPQSRDTGEPALRLSGPLTPPSVPGDSLTLWTSQAENRLLDPRGGARSEASLLQRTGFIRLG